MDDVTSKLYTLSTVDPSIIGTVEDKVFAASMKKFYKEVAKVGTNGDFTRSPTFINVYHKTFNDTVLNKFNKEVKKIKIDSTQRLLSFQDLCHKKLNAFDTFIGITIRPEDYDVRHLMTHEKMTEQEAIAFFDRCNKWMKDNSDIYDVFIENKSINEIIKIVESIK